MPKMAKSPRAAPMPMSLLPLSSTLMSMKMLTASIRKVK